MEAASSADAAQAEEPTWRQRYRALLDALQVGVVAQEADGRIVECNRAAETILGLSLEQMQGLTAFDPRWRATDRDGLPVTGDQHPSTIARRTGRPQSGVVMGVHRADGTRVWVSVNAQPLGRSSSGAPQGVVVSFADITELNEAQAALRAVNAELEARIAERTAELERTNQVLRESEDRYRTLVELAPIGITVHDTETWLFANPAASRLLGAACSGEVVGRGVLEFVVPEDREAVLARMKAIAGGGGPTPLRETRIARPNGDLVEADAIGTAVAFEGRPAVMALLVDVSERRRIERELRESLDEKDVLLREVHHRVKNNMQLVASLLNLQTSGLEDATVRAAFEQARGRIRALAQVHELIYTSGHLGRFPLSRYLRDLAVTLSRALHGVGGSVDLEVEVEEVTCSLDHAVPVGLIVHELVSNAFKHGFSDRERGRVWLHVRATDSGRRCSVVVGDDGVGLPADARLERPGSLGLELVRILTNQIGADLLVEGAGGTRFTVSFSTGDGSVD